MPRSHRSPAIAPNTFRIRRVKDAADAASITNVAQGCNAQGFEDVTITVVPSGGANPNIEVLVWSAGASKFVSMAPTITKTGAGVDTPFEFTFNAKGRIFLPRVSGGIAASGIVEIYASGMLATV